MSKTCIEIEILLLCGKGCNCRAYNLLIGGFTTNKSDMKDINKLYNRWFN